MGWRALPISEVLHIIFINLNGRLTQIFETTVSSLEVEVADSQDTYVVTIHEEVICLVSDFKD